MQSTSAVLLTIGHGVGPRCAAKQTGMLTMSCTRFYARTYMYVCVYIMYVYVSVCVFVYAYA